jgi:hypothetical protein
MRVRVRVRVGLSGEPQHSETNTTFASFSAADSEATLFLVGASSLSVDLRDFFLGCTCSDSSFAFIWWGKRV